MTPADRLAALDACALSDALDRLALPGCVTGLQARLPAVRISGRVHTVLLRPGPAPAGSRTVHLGCAAIEAAQRGEIIVVSQPPGIDCGCWGGVLSRAAAAAGVAGVIADGLVRDIDEACALSFPIFCRGYTARTARGRVHEEATDVPVEISGTSVQPGDYVLADGSGIVFVSERDLDGVLSAAEVIVAREAQMIARIAAGDPPSQVLDARYEHMLKDNGKHQP